jgi:PAS domain S-box-containing protein
METEFSKRLAAIIDTAIDGIITIDEKGNIDTINKAAATLFKYESSEIIGKNIKMLMPEPYHTEHDGYLERYNRTKIPRIIGIGREVSGKRKDGTIFPFRLAVSEVILNDRIIFTGIIHDLSAVHLANEEILRLNKDLEEKVINRTQELEDVVNRLLSTNTSLEEQIERRQLAENELKEKELRLIESLNKEKELNELKSRFVAMASHEFRTPLASILSSAALIQRYPNLDQQDKREKHIGKIKNAVTNLTGILNDFLSLSKLEEGKIQLNFQTVRVDELCKEINDGVSSLLKPNQSIIHVTTSKIKEVVTDERILKNILFNLVTNAIKYSDKDIECLVGIKNENFEIQIVDQGIGIPDAEKALMFTRFFRAENTINIQGTGLGLNIVKRYVDLLNGEISFESELNKGSTFTVKLPINQTTKNE